MERTWWDSAFNSASYAEVSGFSFGNYVPSINCRLFSTKDVCGEVVPISGKLLYILRIFNDFLYFSTKVSFNLYPNSLFIIIQSHSKS
jgi:hypothetical protein